ncbi:hypothetical protein CYMTET_53307 [Cymbomonas tetramitiformis]|uniref:Uncharacterized protein n=1 Tax=Cymbomonas tetramitiformis TaxID=36881 RepID=A0AAE0EQQ6_9CHLO|nr:hypothetical protein CYMTET_53307 [Cymbomonas tetramitiformis]
MEALLNTMMLQMKDLDTRVEAAEEVALKADSQDMPQMFDLYNDKTTYDTLSKHTNCSMRYEKLVLTSTLSYMHDAVAYSESTMNWLMDEKDPPTIKDLGERIYTAHNTFKGIFALLSNGYTMIQLRASMESDAMVHGAADALRAKPAFIEEKVYAGTDGLVTDSVLTKWLMEFHTQKTKAVMNAHAKAGAKVSTFHDRQGGKGKGGGAGNGDGGCGGGKGGRGLGSGRGSFFSVSILHLDLRHKALIHLKSYTTRHRFEPIFETKNAGNVHAFFRLYTFHCPSAATLPSPAMTAASLSDPVTTRRGRTLQEVLEAS